MKEELMSAAASGPTFYTDISEHQPSAKNKICTLSHPQIEQDPGDSIDRAARVPTSDQGRCEPMMAHAKPSSMRYLVLSNTSSGMSSYCSDCTH